MTHPILSRRALLKGAAATGTALAFAPTLRAQPASSAVTPFKIAVPQAKLDMIKQQVKLARIPNPIGDDTWPSGMNTAWLKRLKEHWLTKFDWRAAETEINRFPQLMAKVDSQPIHFFHVPGKSPNAKPVMLVHGWPYSNLSFVPFLERLTDPAKYGGKAEDALTIIAPAIPGHAFSKADKPFGPKRTAALLHTLATEVLGYRRYGFQGGDHGCLVGAYIAAAHPESLFGLHLNLVPVNLPPPAEQSAEDKAWDAAGAAFMQAEFDYFRAQMGKPMMVGSVLAASPFSTAAWIAEKFWAWTDHGGDLDKVVSKDRLLTEIMAYVATDSIESSMWFYRQLRDEIGFRLHPGGRIAVPTGVYLPEKEFVLGNPPRAIIERNYNLVHETRPKMGRHFPFYERPEVFAADIRQFFASLNL